MLYWLQNLINLSCKYFLLRWHYSLWLGRWVLSFFCPEGGSNTFVANENIQKNKQTNKQTKSVTSQKNVTWKFTAVTTWNITLILIFTKIFCKEMYSDLLRAGRSGNRMPVGMSFFRTRPDRLWGPPSLLYYGYRVFLWLKGPGRGVDHPPPSSAEV